MLFHLYITCCTIINKLSVQLTNPHPCAKDCRMLSDSIGFSLFWEWLSTASSVAFRPFRLAENPVPTAPT